MAMFSKFIQRNFKVNFSRHATFTMVTSSSRVSPDAFAMLPDKTTFTLYHKTFIPIQTTNTSDDIFFFVGYI